MRQLVSQNHGCPVLTWGGWIWDSGRVYHYYLPVYYWFEKTLNAHKADSSIPLIVGISAPQGCGKTTLVTALEVLFKHRGVTCGTVSIDDFYLTYAHPGFGFQQSVATPQAARGWAATS